MSTVSRIGFRGETTNLNPTGQCPQVQNPATNFKGYAVDTYEGSEKKKKHRPLLTVGLILAGSAALIAGLGYAHKAGWIEKMKAGGFKDFSEKVTSTCHNWCSKTKQFGKKCWDTVTGWFSKKKS